MEKIIDWWDSIGEYRRKQLAEYHYWSTPEALDEDSIKFIYNQELYGH